MKVYQAINAVQADLGKEGITKSRKNTTQNYNFRGIDDVYNALSPILAKNGLCILPRILSRSCTERQTIKGGTLFYVVVEAEFDLIAAEDGSKHTIRTFGEAMDSADKATNKAMSAAYKYAAMQAFAIPTEGEPDADEETHDVVGNGHPGKPVNKAATNKTITTASPDVAAELVDNDEKARAYIADYKVRVTKATSAEQIREMWRVEGSKRKEHALTEVEIAELVAHNKALVMELESFREAAE